MAGKITNEISVAISGAATDGTITVASTTGIYPRAYGVLFKSGQPGVNIVVAQIIDGTHLKVRLNADPHGGGVGYNSTQIIGNLNYGYVDATLYNGGTMTIHAQVVMNSNDLPLS